MGGRSAARWRGSVGAALILIVALAGAVVLVSGPEVATATTDWTQVTGQPSFAGTTLSGLSCTTSTHCVADGFDGTGAAIRVGDAGTWSAQTPGITGQSTGTLNGVACISATDCVGVGEYTTGGNGFNVYNSLLETWDGTSWSSVTGPQPGDTYNFLFSVSCVAGNAVTPNECIAVGYWESTSGMNTGQRTFVVAGTQPVSGGSWTWQQVTSPNPGMTNNSVIGVACPALGTCIAVGHAETFFQQTGNFSGALALKITEPGGTWTASTLSSDNTGAVLSGVACVSTTSCVAVGNSGSPSQAVAQSWDGSANGFTPLSSPLEPGATNSLSGLACESATNCTAVGSTSPTASSPSSPLVEQYDGTTWTLVNAPSSGTGNASLRSVACDAATNTCTAVGVDNGNALVDTGPGFVPPATTTTTTTTTTATATTAGNPPPTLPTAVTGAPTVAGTRRATFSASSNPHGLPTAVRFEYGLSTKYGSLTPAQPVGADFANHFVTVSVSGLLPNARYHVRAVASNSAGSTLGNDQAFKTAADPPPPRPVLAKSVNVQPISGQVFVKPPPGAVITGLAGAVAAQLVPPQLAAPQGFVPLTEARQIPVGSTLDTLAGTVRLTTATASQNKLQVGDFSAGIFTILQQRRQRGLTNLNLIDAHSARQVCVRAGRAQLARRLSSKVLGLLNANAHGRFTTRGHYSAATVRGTKWSVSNRCDGTLTRVSRGVVVVRDFRRRKNIIVRAGRSYLARAPGG